MRFAERHISQYPHWPPTCAIDRVRQRPQAPWNLCLSFLCQLVLKFLCAPAALMGTVRIRSVTPLLSNVPDKFNRAAREHADQEGPRDPGRTPCQATLKSEEQHRREICIAGRMDYARGHLRRLRRNISVCCWMTARSHDLLPHEQRDARSRDRVNRLHGRQLADGP